LVEAVGPWVRGGLVNFPGDPSAIASLWSDADRTRLEEVLQRHDPAGTFATNLAFGRRERRGGLVERVRGRLSR
jgi:hypothetical protein